MNKINDHLEEKLAEDKEESKLPKVLAEIKELIKPSEPKPAKENKAHVKEQAKSDKEDDKSKYDKMALRMSDRVLLGQLKSKRNPEMLIKAMDAELKRRRQK